MKLDLKHISVYSKDNSGKVILERKLTSMPLKEDIIIAKSIEFFDDPEPCMIHRSAVMARLYSEIGNYIIEAIRQGQKELPLEGLPGNLKNYIDIKEDLRNSFIKGKM